MPLGPRLLLIWPVVLCAIRPGFAATDDPHHRLAELSGKTVMVPPLRILGVSPEAAAHITAVIADALARASTFNVVTASEINTLVEAGVLSRPVLRAIFA